MDSCYPLMIQVHPLKTLVYCCTLVLIHFSRIYMDINPKPTYIGMCAKGQIVLEFSFMWIWVTCLLAFHMPWDRSDLTFHYPIKALYKEPFGYIEGEELKSKKTIVHCCHIFLILESASFCPFGALCVLPKLSFDCELAIERWKIEVVEDLVSLVRRCSDKGCHYCNLWFY